MQTRYADTARLIAVDKKLERLYKEQPYGSLYSEDMLGLLEIPINAAVEIIYNSDNGRMIHMFFGYGIEYVEQGKYRIIKKQ